jgi:hypothetical protein
LSKLLSWRLQRRATNSDDRVKHQFNQLTRKRGQSIRLRFRKSLFDDDILAFYISGVTEGYAKFVPRIDPARSYART